MVKVRIIMSMHTRLHGYDNAYCLGEVYCKIEMNALDELIYTMHGSIHFLGAG